MGSRIQKLCIASAVISLDAMLILMRSYLAIKILCLAVFLLLFLVGLYMGKLRITFRSRLLWFYLLLGIAGIAWSLIGLLHPANYAEGALGALRLYVVWSAIFAFLYTLLGSLPSLRTFHYAMVVAGILVPLVNLAALYGVLHESSFIPESILEELNVEVGFGRGYFQFSSNSIISMFLIAPYLVSLQFRGGKYNSWLTKLALVLSLVLAVVSGRRALWVVVGMTPCAVFFLSKLAGGYSLIKPWRRRVLLACVATAVAGLGAVLIPPTIQSDIAAVDSLREGFSSEDARANQKPRLIQGFLQSPILGSGFGGRAPEYDYEHTWSYELTYFQILFNMGVVGTAFLVCLFSFYLFLAVKVLRQFKDQCTIAFALLIAFLGLLAGAYSNPYFGGFDSLFFAGLLPCLSTFEQGFENS